ncbi:MAG: hypothetical protein HQL39_14470, partial [Alphaproteobacteria bacterium]|nr:hypothetical protein [Alphaproteobacteria bacterium]
PLQRATLAYASPQAGHERRESPMVDGGLAPPGWVSADVASMPMPERGTTGVSMPMPPAPEIQEASHPLSKLWRTLFG